MTPEQLAAHDEALARKAWEQEAAKVGLLTEGSWASGPIYLRETLILAVRLGRENAPQALSSPEHDEAMIAEARRRHGLENPPLFNVTDKIARELLAMERGGWTPETDPDEVAVRAILGAWLGCAAIRTPNPFFDDALAAYREHAGKRGGG